MRNLTMTALVALLGLALLGGCESDSVAPHDPLPALDAEDAARQGGVVAFAVAEIGKRIVDPSKAAIDQTFTGEHGLTGTVMIDYRSGGANGASADVSVADWARLYTEKDAPVVWSTGLGGETAFTIDVAADITRSPDTATIVPGSGGTVVSGDYSLAYAIDGVAVGGSGYPSAGTLTVTSGGHVAVVEFDGSNKASVLVNGTDAYTVDMSSGEVTAD